MQVVTFLSDFFLTFRKDEVKKKMLELKSNPKRYLRDDVANIILTCEECREYVEKIISSVLEVPGEFIKNNLTLKTPRINQNVETKYSMVDAIYETDDIIINLEVNMNGNKTTNIKNMRYVCHLVLSQIPKGMKEEYNLKPIYQININGYDYFKAGKFIYRSYIMEETLHQIRDNFITIIDINMDILSKIDYNEIAKDKNSLEYLLYIFVCQQNEIEKLYKRDEIMEKVKKKLSALTEDFAEGLYYNREEYINQVSYEEGKEAGVKEGKEAGLKEGKKERTFEIAKGMLKKSMNVSDILEITGLSAEELELLKEK